MLNPIGKFITRHDNATDPDVHDAVHDESYAHLGSTTDVDEEHRMLDLYRPFMEAPSCP